MPKGALGVISDTHGMLHPGVSALFRGVNGIVHAGDVGADSVLDELAALAPLTAVRGNTDVNGRAAGLATVEVLEWEGLSIAVVHDLNRFHLERDAGEFIDVVVFGHSHRAEIVWRRGRVFFNPGSAGPRRFGLPNTVGFLTVDQKGVPRPEVVELRPV